MSKRHSLRKIPRKTENSGLVESSGSRRLYSRSKSQLLGDGNYTFSALENAIKATPAKGATSPIKNSASSVKIKENTETHGHIQNHIYSQNASKPGNIIDGWEVGTDPKIDPTGQFDFGGPAGVTIMIICFPLLMYYMWIGAEFYDGKFPTRLPGQSFLDFFKQLAKLSYEHAFPSLYAWGVVWSFFIFEGACYCLLPGVCTYGKPLAHEGGKQLKYYCSGMWSFYTTIVVMASLHYSGVFKLYTIIDEFGPIMSVAICSGFLISVVAYVSALYRGAQHRMTGHLFYDFFMGAELNPRMFGVLDFKMFFEVRLPWFILFGISCAAATRQYEYYGYISAELAFLVMAHFLYANACAKGEELITTTWDMYYEKWGFMLIFWNIAGVPLSYCHSTLYLANHFSQVTQYPSRTPFLIVLFTSYLFVYWIWDTCNSQKNRFRSAERGTVTHRIAFPQLPWREVHNPRIIRTTTGDSILADGWYRYARKIHYTCDLYFALTWALVAGFKSPFPWFYPVFFAGMIVHRAMRDIQRCRIKYGKSWSEYENMVPWLFIPARSQRSSPDTSGYNS